MPAGSPDEIHAQMTAALNERDIDAYAGLYEEGAAMIVPPDGARACGMEEIRAAVKQIMALDPTVRMDVVEKLEANGLAITYTRWRLDGTDAGQRVQMSGRGTLVSRRQPDGDWLVVLENTMTPD
jgi:uncharacterized protein (TIGR02246 family)